MGYGQVSRNQVAGSLAQIDLIGLVACRSISPRKRVPTSSAITLMVVSAPGTVDTLVEGRYRPDLELREGLQPELLLIDGT